MKDNLVEQLRVARNTIADFLVTILNVNNGSETAEEALKANKWGEILFK